MLKDNHNRNFILFYLLYFFITDANIFDALEIIGFSSLLVFTRKIFDKTILSTKLIVFSSFILLPLSFSENIKATLLPNGYPYICISLIISFIFLETKGSILLKKYNNFQIIRLISTAALCPFTYIAGPSASIEDLNLENEKEKIIPFRNLNGIEKSFSGFFKITLGNYLVTFEDLFNNYLLNLDFDVLKLITILFYGFYNFWKYYLLFAGASELCESFLYLINIKVIENFKEPYQAIFYHEIWGKWHLNITDRVRKYLYTPITLISLRNFSGLNTFAKFILIEGFPPLILFSILAIWHGGKITDISFALISVFLTITSRAISKNNKIKNLIKSNNNFQTLISFLSITLFGLALSIYSFEISEDFNIIDLQDNKKLFICFFILVIIYIYFKFKSILLKDSQDEQNNIEERIYFSIFEIVISSSLLIYGIVPLKTGLDFIYYAQ